MSQKKIIDLGAKKIDLNNDDIPIALNYFGRLEVRDWEELFFVAVKCLYMEFPDIISNLCSKDPTQNLFLRTTTIGMKHPQRIAPIIFLETKRTPLQIVQALRKIFIQAGIVNINMTIEVMPPSTSKAEIEKIFAPSEKPLKISAEKISDKKISPPAKKTSAKIKMPVLSLSQSVDEMLAALGGELPAKQKSNSPQQELKPLQEKKSPPPEKNSVGSRDLDVPTFGRLYFVLKGERFGPFANEKMRYIELLKNLAELFPKEMKKLAGRHINSEHRLTLAHGENYLYFREPVMLPNDLFADKGFSDKVLLENTKYFLEKCGLKMESVLF